MADLLLIVRLAGERVALPASDVEAVVELEAITPVPKAAAQVKGLAALRSRVLTVIDCRVTLEAGRSDAGSGDAIIVPLDGHAYALLVDSVEDVIEAEGRPLPLQSPPAPAWSRVARGLVEADGDLLLLVDPQALIAGPAAEAA